MIYFTADPHFQHKNIIRYAGRPFNSTYEMEETIIHNWNKTVHPQDTVYCIGDFIFGTEKEKEEFISRLNGTIVFIWGNHDRNVYLTEGYIHFRNEVILLTHFPKIRTDVRSDTSIIACGHVHEKWKYRLFNNIPMINVGVDVWNFTPISIATLIKYRDSIL